MNVDDERYNRILDQEVASINNSAILTMLQDMSNGNELAWINGKPVGIIGPTLKFDNYNVNSSSSNKHNDSYQSNKNNNSSNNNNVKSYSSDYGLRAYGDDDVSYDSHAHNKDRPTMPPRSQLSPIVQADFLAAYMDYPLCYYSPTGDNCSPIRDMGQDTSCFMGLEGIARNRSNRCATAIADPAATIVRHDDDDDGDDLLTQNRRLQGPLADNSDGSAAGARSTTSPAGSTSDNNEQWESTTAAAPRIMAPDSCTRVKASKRSQQVLMQGMAPSTCDPRNDRYYPARRLHQQQPQLQQYHLPAQYQQHHHHHHHQNQKQQQQQQQANSEYDSGVPIEQLSSGPSTVSDTCFNPSAAAAAVITRRIEPAARRQSSSSSSSSSSTYGTTPLTIIKSNFCDANPVTDIVNDPRHHRRPHHDRRPILPQQKEIAAVAKSPAPAVMVARSPAPPLQQSDSLSPRSCSGGSEGYYSDDFINDDERGLVYHRGRLLGRGGFAKVHLITEVRSNKDFACKIVFKQSIMKMTSKHRQTVREIEIHQLMDHKNIVRLHYNFEDYYNMYMVMEACSNMSLVHVIRNRGKVTQPEARYFLKQMIQGVAHIHSRKIIHRDLKPANIFLTDNMTIKIGDFGLAVSAEESHPRSICGTPNFMAPEMIERQSCGYEVDIWALGINLYTMLVGHPPFDAPSLDEIYERILRCRYRRLSCNVASKWGRDLLRMLLRREPYLRPSLLIINRHPYLSSEFAPDALADDCCFVAPDFADEEEAFHKNFDAQEYIKRQLKCSDAYCSAAPDSINDHSTYGPKSHAQKKQQQQQQQQAANGNKATSWLSRLKLPKMPLFRQRMSRVLCLEARKKRAAAAAAPTNTVKEQTAPAKKDCTSSQSYLMSRALEECLASVAKMPIRARVNPPPLDHHQHRPLFVTKWIDYSNKCGLAFQLSDESVGALFNDGSKISYTRDRRGVEYVSSSNKATRYSRERNVPSHLQDKLELLRHFADYMDKHLTEGGLVTEPSGKSSSSSSSSSRRSSSNKSRRRVPQLLRWLRTSKVMVLELNAPLLQMNFLDDHKKLVVSKESNGKSGADDYLVTFIDGDRRALSHWLSDLREQGCSQELHQRLLYVYKVVREYAEQDLAN